MLRPLRYCATPGCDQLVPRGYCRAHGVRANHVARRWYYTARWLRLRRQVMTEQAYTCAKCAAVGLALEVDHVQPHNGDAALFWSRANLQALCTPCHTRKTRRGE